MTPQYRLTLRKHYGRLSLALLVYYVVTAAAQFAAQYAVLAWAPQWAEAGWFAPALAFLPMYGIGFPLFLWLLPKAPPKELLPEKRSVPARELLPILLMCLGVLYPGNLIGQGLDWLLRSLFRSSSGGNTLGAMMDSSSTWAFFLVGSWPLWK